MPATPPQASDLLRRLPQVEKLLRSAAAARLLERHPRPEVVRCLRAVVDELREAIRAAGDGGDASGGASAIASRLAPERLVEAASRRLATRERPRHRRVINATGIVLHTGLGRAVLPRAAVEALGAALSGYTLVEVDATTGERNRREEHVAAILTELTGAEAATVVNNNASATLIILAALARGREVIISRGQLVEIGGSFRIPDILEESGARLVEVGTTNRTYIDDYRRAVTPETGLLLRVHTSNYEITGFAHHTPLEDLVALGRERGIPVVSDLGSGCLVDLAPFGFRHEPLVEESVRAAADVVCFSGDKLLGGPQAGVIVGRRESVERIRRHPLYRAVRVDKMALIALEATLKLYRDPEHLAQELPALGMLAAPEAEVRRRAEDLRDALVARGADLEAAVVPSAAQAGSGSLPAQELASWAVAVASRRRDAASLAAALRAAEPPVFARVQADRVLLDLRTIRPGEEPLIRRAFLEATGTTTP